MWGVCRYFSLEEALFLADSGRVTLLHNGAAMDLSHVYALLARTPRAMDQYLVYTYLRRAGHIVRRVGTTPPFSATSKAVDAAANAAEMEMDLRDYEFLRSLDKFAPVDLGIDDDELPTTDADDDVDDDNADDNDDDEKDDDDEDDDNLDDDNDASGGSNNGDVDDNNAAVASKKRTATHDKSAKRIRNTNFDVLSVPSGDAIESTGAVVEPTEPCFHLFTTLVKKFKRSAPGAPDFCCIVRNYSEPFPTITESLRMLQRSNGVPLLLCVVQGNSLTFFSMQLPHHHTATTRVRRPNRGPPKPK